MFKSKLEIYIRILCVLSSKIPMNLMWIKTKIKLDEDNLKKHLRLLWNRGLIEEEHFTDNQIYYVISERGLKVLKIINPIIIQAHKIRINEFQVISNLLLKAGYR